MTKSKRKKSCRIKHQCNKYRNHSHIKIVGDKIVREFSMIPTEGKCILEPTKGKCPFEELPPKGRRKD